MLTSTKKLPETTRRGRIETSKASINNPHFLETILRIDGHDVVGLQKSGDIILVDPDTRVKRRFVPPSGMTIESFRGRGNNMPRTSNDGKTIIINREVDEIPYIDDAVYATYNQTPTADLFDRNVIYVVEKDIFVELAISCAIAGQPLPAIFAVPEGEVTDPTGKRIGWIKLVIHRPDSTGQVIESCGVDQTLFEL